MSAPSPLTVPLENIASCFEGILPSTICSCSKDGTPNLTYLSIVHLLDDRHVGLSYQFFNKTRRNIMENPMVQVVVVSPETAYQYRLSLCYERTETEGPTFDRMKSDLDAVASQTGMSHVFKLRGVDIYRVLECLPFDSQVPAESPLKTDSLPELEAFSERLAACGDLDSLLDTGLDALSTIFGIDHSFVMALDEDGTRLYTLASHGYAGFRRGLGSMGRRGDPRRCRRTSRGGAHDQLGARDAFFPGGAIHGSPPGQDKTSSKRKLRCLDCRTSRVSWWLPS